MTFSTEQQSGTLTRPLPAGKSFWPKPVRGAGTQGESCRGHYHIHNSTRKVKKAWGIEEDNHICPKEMVD